MNWKKLDSKYLSEHPYFRARVDKCEQPNGTIVDEYFVVELPVSACALAITADEQAIMIKQYRHPIEASIFELPGGFIEDKEDPAIGIARELQEETGFVFSNIYPVGKIAANPGVLNNFTYLYLATGGIKTSEQSLDANEDIQVKFIPIEQVRKMLENNEIVQALHNSCLYYALKKWDALTSHLSH